MFFASLLPDPCTGSGFVRRFRLTGPLVPVPVHRIEMKPVPVPVRCYIMVSGLSGSGSGSGPVFWLKKYPDLNPVLIKQTGSDPVLNVIFVKNLVLLSIYFIIATKYKIVIKI